MNILFIGNSFSSDTTRYLQEIADGKLYVRNLFIGGCSLEQHYNNFQQRAELYEYQINAERQFLTCIQDAIKERKWDYITLQQCSLDSGYLPSYEPYITELIKGIKQLCPTARLVFLRTWAYEDGNPTYLERYGDRRTMFSEIKKTTQIIAQRHNLPLVPIGDAVEMARLLPEFSTDGNLQITLPDKLHLSSTYGRYLAGLVCYAFFTNDLATNVTFEPQNTQKDINHELKKIVDKIFNK